MKRFLLLFLLPACIARPRTQGETATPTVLSAREITLEDSLSRKTERLAELEWRQVRPQSH